MLVTLDFVLIMLSIVTVFFTIYIVYKKQKKETETKTEYTTLWIKKSTHKRLEKDCPKTYVYDDFINELLDSRENSMIPFKDCIDNS